MMGFLFPVDFSVLIPNRKNRLQARHSAAT